MYLTHMKCKIKKTRCANGIYLTEVYLINVLVKRRSVLYVTKY